MRSAVVFVGDDFVPHELSSDGGVLSDVARRRCRRRFDVAGDDVADVRVHAAEEFDGLLLVVYAVGQRAFRADRRRRELHFGEIRILRLVAVEALVDFVVRLPQPQDAVPANSVRRMIRCGERYE